MNARWLDENYVAHYAVSLNINYKIAVCAVPNTIYLKLEMPAQGPLITCIFCLTRTKYQGNGW